MRRLAWLLLAAATTGSGGCSEPGVGRVSGNVTLDGQPLAGAEVKIWPKDDPSLGAATAVTKADGSFVVFKDPRPGAGLKPGRYVILVAKFGGARPAAPTDAAVAPAEEGILPGTFNQLPRRYNDKDQSPFVIEFTRGDNTIQVALESRPPS
jgi:hypothetical protein